MDIDEVRRERAETELTSLQCAQSKLNGDEGSIYLFQWLASTEKVLRTGTPVCFLAIRLAGECLTVFRRT